MRLEPGGILFAFEFSLAFSLAEVAAVVEVMATASDRLVEDIARAMGRS